MYTKLKFLVTFLSIIFHHTKADLRMILLFKMEKCYSICKKFRNTLYEDLENQRNNNYDNFLRSNIDNEQDNRNFDSELGRDMLASF